MELKTFSTYLVLVSLAAASFLPPARVEAANPQSFTTNYNLAARAVLTVTPAIITFPDSDPAAVPSVPATGNPVLVTVKVRKDPSAVLTATLVCQGGPLVSGADSIASGNVTWTATGTGFASGTLNNAVAANVGSWSASGVYNGTLSFYLNNLWSYAAGNYSGNILYTLTAP